jgi:hypothetical protein
LTAPIARVSRLIKDSEGNLKYETFSEEPGRPAKVAAEIGVEYFVYADLNYTPSDIQLRVRMIRPASGEVAWTNEYSTANIISDRQRIVGREYGIEQAPALGEQNEGFSKSPITGIDTSGRRICSYRSGSILVAHVLYRCKSGLACIRHALAGVDDFPQGSNLLSTVVLSHEGNARSLQRTAGDGNVGPDRSKLVSPSR